jgi:hypothetical protein
MASLTDYGFPFNSVTSDRTYNADVWRDYFKNLFTDGVAKEVGNQLMVTESDTPAKSVKVDTGAVIIQGAQFALETTIDLTIADNSSGSTRIDRVVARLDYTNRTCEIEVLQGTAGAGAPALTQGASVWEISLAQIQATNGFTTILNADITDERTFSKSTGQDIFEKENDLLQYDRDVTTTDTNNDPTEIQYTRPADDSLFLKRTYSNPDANGWYQTITEEFYESDGTTIYKTYVYTLTYLSNGIVDTMTRAVSY